MATFGAPIMLEDHALRACRCAVAIQAALTAAGSPVKMRIGINSGEALITDVVAGAHRSYDTHGPTVNLVSRIEAEALPGSVFISEGTFRLVDGAFTYREIGARSFKGFSEPQLLYELLHEEANPNLRGLAGHRIVTPFMGREQDLTAATAMLASLQSGKGGLLLVVGEAGVGKSRLLCEMRNSTSAALQWLQGHCDAFSEQISFWPFIELLGPVVGLTDMSMMDKRWARPTTRNLTDLLGHEVDELLPYIATFLGIEVGACEQADLRRLEAEVIGAHIFVRRGVCSSALRSAARSFSCSKISIGPIPLLGSFWTICCRFHAPCHYSSLCSVDRNWSVSCHCVRSGRETWAPSSSRNWCCRH